MSPHAKFTLFWFVIAVLLAALEVEIEGPNGWAMALPTYVRVRGLPARVFAFFMGGRPLTGYHAIMFPLTVLIVHAPYAVIGWSPANEAATLAQYMLLALVWDFLWFALNPAFGLKKFNRTDAPWHAFEPWVLKLPLSYWLGMVASGIFALISDMLGNDGFLPWHGAFALRLAAFTFGVCLIAPAYRHWRRGMDEVDERGLIVWPKIKSVRSADAKLEAQPGE